MTDLPLQDRIALVVGASRGIGYESALALAKAGAHVVATARTQGGLEELDDAIYAATGKHATLIPFDLVDGGGIDRMGGALYERMAYDDEGQLVNASFMDFLMPYATEVPARIEIDHLETPSPLNPLGIKGAGEAGCIPVTAVIASAISDAEGITVRRMPISPSELHALRRQREEQP